MRRGGKENGRERGKKRANRRKESAVRGSGRRSCRRSGRMFSAEGTVSVYLMLLIVPIFLFNAILIDYSRIKLAGKQSEAATRAAVRSVLSAFDGKVLAYGLFGQGQSAQQNKELFEQVLHANLQVQTDAYRFRYADVRPVDGSARLQQMFTLGDQVVFKRQILEDMKYKAPLEFALNVFDKLKKTKADERLAQASAYAELSREVEQRMEQREERLDEAWDRIALLKQHLQSLHDSYEAKLNRLNELAGLIGLRTLTEVRQALEDISKQLEQANRQAEEMNRQLNYLNQTIAAIAISGAPDAGIAIGPLIEQASRLASALRSLNDQIRSLTAEKEQLSLLLSRIIEYTALAAETKAQVVRDDEQVLAREKEIQELLGEARRLNREIRERVDAGNATNSSGEELEAGQVFRQVALSDDYFDEYQTGIAAVLSAFHGFRQRLETSESFLDGFYEALIEDNDRYAAMMDDFYAKFREQEDARRARTSDIRRQKQEASQNLKSLLDEAKAKITGCPPQYAESTKAAYARLTGSDGTTGLFSKYMAYNDVSEEKDPRPEMPAAVSPEMLSFDMTDRLLAALENLRDELYMNEYALSKFNYRTLDAAEAAGNETGRLPDPSGHALPSQEVEYILYGFGSCEGNYMAAYAEMFAFRLAFRAAESLMDPDRQLLNAASPHLVLLLAFVEGARKAFDDMNKLLAGENVPLMKMTGNAVTLNYKDYLRLFLLLHSSNRNMMSRMQALIELNTGVDLTKLTTYVQGTDTTSIRLWFIPAAMNILQRIGLLNCKVNGNRCELTQTAVLSY